MDTSSPHDIAQGLDMTTHKLITETIASTMAPNLGPSCAAVGGEDILRRDSGDVSFGGSSHLALFTPMDFRSTAPSQNQPDNGRDDGHYFPLATTTILLRM